MTHNVQRREGCVRPGGIWPYTALEGTENINTRKEKHWTWEFRGQLPQQIARQHSSVSIRSGVANFWSPRWSRAARVRGHGGPCQVIRHLVWTPTKLVCSTSYHVGECRRFLKIWEHRGPPRRWSSRNTPVPRIKDIMPPVSMPPDIMPPVMGHFVHVIAYTGGIVTGVIMSGRHSDRGIMPGEHFIRLPRTPRGLLCRIWSH